MMNDVIAWIVAHARDVITGAIIAVVAYEVVSMLREIRDHMRDMRHTLHEIRDSLRR